MPLSRRTVLKLMAGTTGASSLGLLPNRAWAAYPDRPIRLVVPFAAGGNADTQGRVIALTNLLHQRIDRHWTVGAEQQRVAVGCGARDGLGADTASGAGAIVDHDGLAEMQRRAVMDYEHPEAK